MSKKCDPREVALKSFFLGPQSENAEWVHRLLTAVFDQWVEWRKELFPEDGVAISPEDQLLPEFADRKKQIEKVTHELMDRLEREVPKFSPRYVGHMFSEISLPALVGHIVALLHNPNNISGETSRVGMQIENESVRALLEMVGFSQPGATGHFTSGGTLANLEALIRGYSRMSLWISLEAALNAKTQHSTFDFFSAAHMGWLHFEERLSQAKTLGLSEREVGYWNLGADNPIRVAARLSALGQREYVGPVILVPENMHYSWKKGCRILGLGDEALWPIRLDPQAKLSITHLRELLGTAKKQGRPVMMVVSVVGTTELGGIDPVHEVQDELDAWKKNHGIHIWHHVDAAYGGFFLTMDSERSSYLSDASKQALVSMRRTDSATLDPHKLGYVPYASGAFLVRDERDYYFKTFQDAPYIDFDRTADRGPYTIEGSRSAAGAVATWMTSQTMGFNPGGYGLLLERTIRICRDLGDRLESSGLSVRVAPGGDTNVLCFVCAKDGEKLSLTNQRTLGIFQSFSPRKNGHFIVSKTTLKWKSYSAYLDRWTRSWSAERDTDELMLVRMCMMNPFFESKETRVNYMELFIENLRKEIS